LLPNSINNYEKVFRLILNFPKILYQKYLGNLMNKMFKKKHFICLEWFISKLEKIQNLNRPFLRKQLFVCNFDESNYQQYDSLFSFYANSIQAIHNHHFKWIHLNYLFLYWKCFSFQHTLSVLIPLYYCLMKIVYDFVVCYLVPYICLKFYLRHIRKMSVYWKFEE